MSFLYLPKELLNVILEYDGKIKYKYTKGNYKNGNYINIIHKYDERYKIIHPIISRKLKIIKKCIINDITNKNRFYLEFFFENINYRGLCYDYYFSSINKCQICFFDLRADREQIIPYIT